MNLSDLLAQRAVEFGDRGFLFFERQAVYDESNNIDQECFRQTLTFSELDERAASRCAYWLVKNISILLNTMNADGF